MGESELLEATSSKKARWRDRLGSTFAVLLFIQVLIALAITGGIARGEASFFAWEEVSKELYRFGKGNAVFTAFVYLLYYAFLVELAFCGPRVLRWAKRVDWPRDQEQSTRILRRRGVLASFATVCFGGIFFVYWINDGLSTDGFSDWSWPLEAIFCGLILLLWKILEHLAKNWNYDTPFLDVHPPLSQKARGRIMLLAILAASASVTYAIYYSLQIHEEIREKMLDRENREVIPRFEEGGVGEVGKIFSLRREIIFRERREEITWWVRVPSTGATFWCGWSHGYASFSDGDEVEIIHRQEKGDSPGSLVGLHGGETGHRASVDIWTTTN